MVNEATEALKSENVGNSFVNWPVEVKKHYPDLTAANFVKNEMKVEVEDERNKGSGTLWYIYCSMCKNKSLIPLMFRDMLPHNTTVEDVLTNWDKIKRKKKFAKCKYRKDMWVLTPILRILQIGYIK